MFDSELTSRPRAEPDEQTKRISESVCSGTLVVIFRLLLCNDGQKQEGSGKLERTEKIRKGSKRERK